MTFGAALGGEGEESHSLDQANMAPRAPPTETYLGVNVQPVGRLPFVVTLLEPLGEEVARDRFVRVSLAPKAETEGNKPEHECMCV